MKKPPFDLVVRTYAVRILRFCRSMHVQLADAEDAYSEAFLAALSGYAALPDDANIEAWLVRIARNACIDVHRRNARRAIPVEHLPEPGWTADGATVGGSALLSARETDREIDVLDMLWLLTDRQREAIAWHHVWGLPYTEVAALIGGSPAAVRRAASDGIAALRIMVVRQRAERHQDSPPGTEAQERSGWRRTRREGPRRRGIPGSREGRTAESVEGRGTVGRSEPIEDTETTEER